MDTKPIFNFINEVATFSQLKNMPTNDYFELLRKLFRDFKKNLFDCCVETNRFKEELPTIKHYMTDLLDKLNERQNNQEKRVSKKPTEENKLRLRIIVFCIGKTKSLINEVELLGGGSPLVEKTNTIVESVAIEEMSKNVEVVDKGVQKTIDDEWLNVDDVCRVFGLAKNSVKDRQWRIRNHFPSGNQKPKERCIFSRTAVEEWLKKRD